MEDKYLSFLNRLLRISCGQLYPCHCIATVTPVRLFSEANFENLSKFLLTEARVVPERSTVDYNLFCVAKATIESKDKPEIANPTSALLFENSTTFLANETQS